MRDVKDKRRKLARTIFTDTLTTLFALSLVFLVADAVLFKVFLTLTTTGNYFPPSATKASVDGAMLLLSIALPDEPERCHLDQSLVLTLLAKQAGRVAYSFEMILDHVDASVVGRCP